MNEISLFRTHIWDELTQAHYKQLAEQSAHSEILFDATKGNPLPDAFNFTITDYENCPYPKAQLKDIFNLPLYQKMKNIYHGETLKVFSWDIYFNPEYAVLFYYLKNPGYDYYWSIEYDILINGDWRVLFDACKNDDSAMLGTYVRLFQSEPPFSKIWDTLNFDVKPEAHKICYGPIIRYSNKALRLLHESLLQGKHGFYEVLAPTLCHLAGMKITDIYDFVQPNGNKFYHPQTFNGGHSKNIWTEDFMAKYKNYMFHPV